MNTITASAYYTDKRAFLTLTCLCASLFVLYIYFISASVVYVVMRTEASQDNIHIASEISQLESKYIQAQHKVSSDIASLQGYEKTASKVFIDRAGSSLVLQTVGR